MGGLVLDWQRQGHPSYHNHLLQDPPKRLFIHEIEFGIYKDHFTHLNYQKKNTGYFENGDRDR